MGGNESDSIRQSWDHGETQESVRYHYRLPEAEEVYCHAILLHSGGTSWASSSFSCGHYQRSRIGQGHVSFLFTCAWCKNAIQAARCQQRHDYLYRQPNLVEQERRYSSWPFNDGTQGKSDAPISAGHSLYVFQAYLFVFQMRRCRFWTKQLYRHWRSVIIPTMFQLFPSDSNPLSTSFTTVQAPIRQLSRKSSRKRWNIVLITASASRPPSISMLKGRFGLRTKRESSIHLQ